MADALSRLGWNTHPPKEDNPSVVAAMEAQKPEKHFFSHELDINLEEFCAKQEDLRLKPYLLIHRNDAGLATLEGKGQVLVPAPFIQTILSSYMSNTVKSTLFARMEWIRNLICISDTTAFVSMLSNLLQSYEWSRFVTSSVI